MGYDRQVSSAWPQSGGRVREGGRAGWSVVVTGRATVVSDPAEHERLPQTGPSSWTPLRDAVFVRIESEMVTGRELGEARGMR